MTASYSVNSRPEYTTFMLGSTTCASSQRGRALHRHIELFVQLLQSHGLVQHVTQPLGYTVDYTTPQL